MDEKMTAKTPRRHRKPLAADATADTIREALVGEQPIVLTEVVGIVHPDPEGEIGMFEAACRMATEVLATRCDRDDEAKVSIGFTYGQHRFVFGAEPLGSRRTRDQVTSDYRNGHTS